MWINTSVSSLNIFIWLGVSANPPARRFLIYLGPSVEADKLRRVRVRLSSSPTVPCPAPAHIRSSPQNLHYLLKHFPSSYHHAGQLTLARERTRTGMCHSQTSNRRFADRLMSHLSTQFSTGRGGAGNIHRSQSRDAAMTAEQFAQVRRGREPVPSPTTNIGRGGAGNFIDPAHPRESCKHSASVSALSSFCRLFRLRLASGDSEQLLTAFRMRRPKHSTAFPPFLHAHEICAYGSSL